MKRLWPDNNSREIRGMKLRHTLLTTTCAAFMIFCVGSAYAIDLEKQEQEREAQPNTIDHPSRKEVDYQKEPFAVLPVVPKHLLYIATPGDGGADGQSGLIVLDADNDYRFVKRIPWGIPASELPGEKVTGISASVPLNMVYVAFFGHMVGIDLKTDKTVWSFDGEAQPVARHYNHSADSGCCERPWTLPDGKTQLVGSSYNNWWYYIDGASGKVLGKIVAPDSPVAHNLAVSPDGKIGMLGSLTPTMSIVDVPNRSILRTITFSDSVRPLAINHDGSLVYATLNNLDGFEIGDTKTGKMVKRVELPADMWKAKWMNPTNHFFGHSNPSHGIGLTPDDSEIWVSDDVNVAWQVWDNPGDGRNPVYNPSKTVHVQPGVASSWITMTNDGKTAILGDGTIVDLKAHKAVGILKDENGRPIHGTEKVLFFTFENGKLMDTDNQFAEGDPKAFAARMAGGSSHTGKQAAK
jgi:hypothetical protein